MELQNVSANSFFWRPLFSVIRSYFQWFQGREAKVGALKGAGKDPTEKGRGAEAAGRREPRVEDGH